MTNKLHEAIYKLGETYIDLARLSSIGRVTIRDRYTLEFELIFDLQTSPRVFLINMNSEDYITKTTEGSGFPTMNYVYTSNGKLACIERAEKEVIQPLLQVWSDYKTKLDK